MIPLERFKKLKVGEKLLVSKNLINIPDACAMPSMVKKEGKIVRVVKEPYRSYLGEERWAVKVERDGFNWSRACFDLIIDDVSAINLEEFI